MPPERANFAGGGERQQVVTQRSTAAGQTPGVRARRASLVASRFGWRGLESNGGYQKAPRRSADVEGPNWNETSRAKPARSMAIAERLAGGQHQAGGVRVGRGVGAAAEGPAAVGPPHRVEPGAGVDLRPARPRPRGRGGDGGAVRVRPGEGRRIEGAWLAEVVAEGHPAAVGALLVAQPGDRRPVPDRDVAGPDGRRLRPDQRQGGQGQALAEGAVEGGVLHAEEAGRLHRRLEAGHQVRPAEGPRVPAHGLDRDDQPGERARQVVTVGVDRVLVDATGERSHRGPGLVTAGARRHQVRRRVGGAAEVVERRVERRRDQVVGAELLHQPGGGPVPGQRLGRCRIARDQHKCECSHHGGGCGSMDHPHQGLSLVEPQETFRGMPRGDAPDRIPTTVLLERQRAGAPTRAGRHQNSPEVPRRWCCTHGCGSVPGFDRLPRDRCRREISTPGHPGQRPRRQEVMSENFDEVFGGACGWPFRKRHPSTVWSLTVRVPGPTDE